MIPIIEDAVLGSDLDCMNFDLKNIGLMVPAPDNLVGIDSPALSDGRTVPNGSVTDDTVNYDAGIAQNKINFHPPVPTAWLGNSAKQAARGDLAERLSRKGAPNGYAALDSTGRIPLDSTDIADAIEAGTVTSVGLHMPVGFNITGENPVTTAGTLHVHWNDAPSNSWFGVVGPVPPQNRKIPTFLTRVITHDMVPDLNGAKFTSGVFALARLPRAIGVGTGHAAGLVPDPGAAGSPLGYLGRDMHWRNFRLGESYQPVVPDVMIVLESWSEGKANVTIRSTLPGSVLLYRVTAQAGLPPTATFIEALHDDMPDDVHINIDVNDYDFIEAYAAKGGYTNSDIQTWEVVTPITTLDPPPIP